MDTPFYIVGDRPPGSGPKLPTWMGGKKPPKPAEKKDVIEFDRNLFVQGESTDPKLEKVEIDKGLRDEYARFLKGYITNLDKLRFKNDPVTGRNLFDEVLKNDSHIYDRELWGLFVKESFDEQGRPIRREGPLDIDTKKIDDFLKTSRGLEISNQLLEYQTQLKLFALGLHAALRQPGFRANLAEPQLIDTGIDQGSLNQIYRALEQYFNESATTSGGRSNVEGNVIMRNLRRSHIAQGVLRTVPFLGATAMANPLLAAGAFGAEFATLGLLHLSRGGVKLDLRQCSAAFQQIQGNATEAAYLKAVAGIDVNDLLDNLNNRITRVNAPGYQPGTMRNAENDLKQEVLYGVQTRLKYYTALKVPPQNLDALPTQAQYWNVGNLRGQPEQTGAQAQIKIRNEFERLGGYTPGNIQQNIERYMEAQRNMLLGDLKEYIRDQQNFDPKKFEKSTFDNTRISTINAKKDAREENGELYQERTGPFREVKELGEAFKVIVQEGKDGLNPYQEKLKALEDAVKEAQDSYGFSDVSVINLGIENRRQSLIDEAIPGSYAAQKATIEADRIAAVNAVDAGIPTAIVGNNRIKEAKNRTEIINERAAARQANLKEDVKDRIDREIGELRGIRRKIEDAQTALGENEELVRQNQEKITRLETDFDNIAGPANGVEARLTAAGIVPPPLPGPPPVPWSLSEADLRTLPINVLLQRVNLAFAAAPGLVPPVGWPEVQNTRPELRRLLLNAVVEARARGIEPQITVPGVDFQNLTNPGGLNISENQLRVLSNDQIIQILTARGVTPGALPAGASIEAARTAAQGRFRARINAYEQESNVLNEFIQNQEDQIAGVNFEGEKRQLELTSKLMERQGEIYSKAYEFAYDSQRLLGINPTPPPPLLPIPPGDPTFSRQERTAAQPRGYYEIMDILFDYRNKPDRGEYFEKVRQFLPPDRLASILNDSLDFGIVAPFTINDVLLEMNAGLTDGILASPDIRRAFRNVIDRVYREANAL